MMSLQKLRFPIGEFEKPSTPYSKETLAGWIDSIASLPEKLEKEVTSLTEEQLSTPYRPEGWTVKQVVHHLADSHINSFIRFKLALTEPNPTIKPYDENLWAALIDSNAASVKSSLYIISGVHERWTILLKSMTSSDLQKTFFHPAQGETIRLDEAIAKYAWHSEHHLAHITTLKQTKGWT